MGLDIFATGIQDTEKGHIIRLHGDLDEIAATKFTKFMDDFLDNQKPDAVILDCQNISSCNSKAVQALIKLYQNMRMLKKGLILSRISAPMSSVIVENDTLSQIPTYGELDRAIEIAKYFLSKKENYDKRKLESLRETPAALMKDDKGESIFQSLNIKEPRGVHSTSKKMKKPRTSETMKRYTTEDFTAWFKPEQSRRLRQQTSDILIIQSPNAPFNYQVTNVVDELCSDRELVFQNLLPLENRLNWDQALELVNNAKTVIIDFSTPQDIYEDNVIIMTIASIVRLQKVEDQIILINSTEQMPVLWRDMPVIYYDNEEENLIKLKEKISIKLP